MRPSAPEEPASLSGTTATTLAITTEAVALGAVIGGAGTKALWLQSAGFGVGLIAPSMGHLYAGEYGHALGMSALRAAGLAAFGLGLAQAWATDRSSDNFAIPLMLVGGGTLLAATGYDIWDAHNAVHRTNEARHVALVPSATPHGGGLALVGSF